jgi:NAD+ synthase (glutamine-hydrolysing)
MKHGYIRAAAMTPVIKVADCEYNTEKIIELACKAFGDSVRVAVFPEMCITGYTCNDLFLHEELINSAKKSLAKIAERSKEWKGMLMFVGLPYELDCKLYNVAAAVCDGEILGLVPKKNIPDYGEFYERRQFTPGFDKVRYTDIDGKCIPIGAKLLFKCANMKELVVGAEICEDLWVPQPPSIKHALNGATLIVNCSASNETVGKKSYRKDLVSGQSARLVCAYVYASAGEGESTQDIVFGGADIICENGTVLGESELFSNTSVYSDIDIRKISAERRRMSTYVPETDEEYTFVDFNIGLTELELSRKYEKTPFVPADKARKQERCEEILNIQTFGLKKRLVHTSAKSAVIGLSGGLDSTLALLVTVRAFDACGLDRKGIICVTMPCFGTTDRTYNNAVTLAEKLGCTLREIDIKEAVLLHFRDIGHDEAVHDVTYENGQARERTQILMDIANQTGGLVIGTGDMSELALGWATYNGDHMSMYGVNASVPKTLVRHLVGYYADTCGDSELKNVLYDILDTPVSPELLPPSEDGTIAQKTEDLVGPYELHDFFLYHMLRSMMTPEKIFRIARQTFGDTYDDCTIYKWLRTFTWRFFAQQFKRSCLPDGPKVGTVAVSPRGDLRMPSDASSALWMSELDKIKSEYGF